MTYCTVFIKWADIALQVFITYHGESDLVYMFLAFLVILETPFESFRVVLYSKGELQPNI